MKVSVAWLQKYFDDALPGVDEIVDALTFHSCEIEEVIGVGEDAVLDVKVLPDRASYALSHRGIALELGASLGRSMSSDPLRASLPEYPEADIKVSIDDPLCLRYMAGRVNGVRVGPSPEWLQQALKRLGQRSINNVVDATNYVMLNIGQPLHAFDAAKLSSPLHISVRGAKEGEKITTLTGEEYTLPAGTLLITDGANGQPLGIAGVKGGKAAEITETTTDIIVESANFDGTSVRKAAQALKLWTDASARFQNKLSPELAAYGMRDVIALIIDIAGGKLEGVVDVYPNPETAGSPVAATREMLNGLLGTSFTTDEISSALSRLALTYVLEGETFTVQPPFERRDLVIWQDVAEEVGRILGYDRVESAALPAMTEAPDQKRFAGIEALKDFLTTQGYTEISTQAFAAEGDIQLANPLQQERPWLRASLVANMQDALARAANVAPLMQGPKPMLKLFELGNVFKKDGEHLSLALGYRQLTGKASDAVLVEALDGLTTTFPAAGLQPGKLSDGIVEVSLKDAGLESIGEGYAPERIALSSFRSFSLYPFALRDIAVWTPDGTEESEVSLLIEKEAGELLARIDQFDRFEKDGRISYAFRLVFQALDRTLSDTDIDPVMVAITETLNGKESWEVR